MAAAPDQIPADAGRYTSSLPCLGAVTFDQRRNARSQCDHYDRTPA
jgi:hypothetical protein